MLNEIIKILSLVTNRNIYVKESRLCLLNIQYEKNVIIDECISCGVNKELVTAYFTKRSC